MARAKHHEQRCAWTHSDPWPAPSPSACARLYTLRWTSAQQAKYLPWLWNESVLRLWHAQQAAIGGATAVVRVDDAEAPLFVLLRHGHLEVQVPLEHRAHIWGLARHLERLLQELSLLLRGDLRAVFITRRRRRIGTVAEFRKPDLLAAVAVLDHDVAVFARASERKEAVVGIAAA